MQGRTAMWHALGDAVAPLDLTTVSSNVFTSPEIATVGWTQAQVDAGEVTAAVVNLPLATNARAKMAGIHDGFVKVISPIDDTPAFRLGIRGGDQIVEQTVGAAHPYTALAQLGRTMTTASSTPCSS